MEAGVTKVIAATYQVMKMTMFHCNAIRSSNYYIHVYSRFHCNETRVIYITGYFALITFSYSRFLLLKDFTKSGRKRLQH